MLFLEGVLDQIHNVSFGQWTVELDYRTLCIDLNALQNVSMWSSNMLWDASRHVRNGKVSNGPILECKWEAFKKATCSCTKKCILFKSMPYKGVRKCSSTDKIVYWRMNDMMLESNLWTYSF